MPHLEVDKLNVVLTDFELKDINFSIEKGNVLSLLGASGAGKTTLIRAISGLIPITSGKVVVNGRVINDIPVHKRKIGMVFQDFALFPHLNVFGNISFGLKFNGLTKKQIKIEVEKLLELFGLKGYENRDVTSLSGGEKQRVALARTLAPKPEIILFDEPLSAIDEELRVKLREELASIQKQLGFTAIYVTHDRDEAFYLADILGIFEDGKLIQIDKPQNVYNYPVSTSIASFLGIENRLSAVVDSVYVDRYFGKINEDTTVAFKSKESLSIGESVELFIKPNTIHFIPKQQIDEENCYQVSVIQRNEFGSKTEFILDFKGFKVKAMTLSDTSVLTDYNNVTISIDKEKLLVYKNGRLIS
ncbi:MAG: ABC transporter ATP-binding protein [Candidatus Cloacimonas sp.]|nr:ABC transporter ATP-binding protein [Candidatus Cloacimonadota bacterium]